MERLNTLFSGVKGGWNSMDKKKKISMITIIVCAFLLIILLTVYNNNTNYSILFSNLELKDAGEIVSDLESKKISYKLENDGKDILIDSKNVDEYRLQLAMEGMMPENSTGFELFDDVGMMLTDEDRKILYQRALSGELERSIMSLESVNSSKVLLVLAEESIFDTELKESSASVVLDMNSTSKVTEDMIRGIVALVSGAVNNLPEENIQVIDSKGNLLSNDIFQEDGVNAVDIINNYQQIRENFQNKMENSLDELLGTAYGKDKIKISVYADLDFDSEESTIISYENPVIVSEQTTASGGNLDIQQVTEGTVDDNASNVVETNGNGDTSSYSKTINNELTEETTVSIKAPGKVLKLTTSVIYDGDLTEEELTKIRNIVATATGYDVNRGDLISVEGVPFDKTYEEQLQIELDAIKAEEEANRTFYEKYKDYFFFGLIGLLGLIILISFIRFLFGARKKKESKVVEEQLAFESPVEGNVNIVDEKIEKLDVVSNADEKKIKNYADENPEIAADLIKAWIKE